MKNQTQQGRGPEKKHGGSSKRKNINEMKGGISKNGREPSAERSALLSKTSKEKSEDAVRKTL